MPVLAASIAHHLLVAGIPIAEKVLRTAGVYVGLVLLLRLGGKRDLAQLNSFDLVVLLLLSNVVQNAVIGDDLSLTGGLIGASVLVALNAVIVRLVRRSDTSIRLFEGSPSILVRRGVIEESTIRDLGIRRSDVMSALRRQGANTVEEVEEARLEPGGTIVVDLRPEDENASKGDLQRVEAKLDAVLARLGPAVGPADGPAVGPAS